MSRRFIPGGSAKAGGELKGELTDHGIAASAELACELPPVVGHRGQLQEVITNLLHNAMETMTTIQPYRRLLKVPTKPDVR